MFDYIQVGETGHAVGVEHVPQLVEMSLKNVRKSPELSALLLPGSSTTGAPRLRLVQADGRRGYPEGGPYDAIHVGAAAKRIPEDLVAQLRPGGRLVLPSATASSPLCRSTSRPMAPSLTRTSWESSTCRLLNSTHRSVRAPSSRSFPSDPTRG